LSGYIEIVFYAQSMCEVVCVCAMKANGGSGGVAPLIFNFSSRWRWVVSFLL